MPNNESIEIEIIPVPPDTVAVLQGSIVSDLETKLREEGYAALLDNGQIRLEIERNFPTDETIRLIIEIVGTGITIVDKIVIPYLERKAEVKRKGKTEEELTKPE